MRIPRLAATMTGLALLVTACSEGSLISPGLNEGGSRIWEVSAAELPSAFDIVTGRRLFLGTGDINASVGDIFLGGPPSSTELHLRSIAGLLLGEAVHPVGLQDLGAIDFEALDGVPRDGYTDSEDTTGVSVVVSHVYALRIQRSSLGDNFAKLIVDAVGQAGGDPDTQFIDFRYVVQTQPGNEDFNED
jgi:hypothetical protein